MIKRDPPFHFDVACDGCSDGEVRVVAIRFRTMVQEIKELGWTIRMSKEDELEHFCPDCSEERGYAR